VEEILELGLRLLQILMVNEPVTSDAHRDKDLLVKKKLKGF